MKLIAIGDNVCDVYIQQNKIYPGGNALNVSVFARKYGAERISYMGIVGTDQEGRHIIDTLEKEGVDISRMRRACGETGKAEVALDEDGDRKFVGWNKGGVQSELKLYFNEADQEYIDLHDVIHTSVYSFIENDLQYLSQIKDISFDFSTKIEKHYLQEVCPFIRFAFFSGSHLSDDEIHHLIEEVHGYGVENVAITRGVKGVIYSNRLKVYKKNAIKTDVIDTLGAGDTFVATFLVNFYNNSDIEETLNAAITAAAETCKFDGAFGYGISI